MSIKQPYGFIWQITDLIEIHQQVSIYREELRQLFLDELFDLVANRAVVHYDDDCLMGRPIKTEVEYLQQAYETIHAFPEQIVVNHHILNPETILYIIPRNGKLLGVINFLHPEAQQIWFNKPFVKGWGCYTSGDQPDEIPDEEWAERIEDWSFHGYYNELGFSMTCHSKHPAFLDVMSAICKKQFNLFQRHYMSFERRTELRQEHILNKHFDGQPGFLKVKYDKARDELGLFKDINKLTPVLFGGQYDPVEVARKETKRN